MSGAPIKSLDPNLLLEASRVMNAAGRDYVNATKLVSDWALKNQAKADPEIRSEIIGDAAALRLRVPENYDSALELLADIDTPQCPDANGRLHLLRALANGQKYKAQKARRERLEKEASKSLDSPEAAAQRQERIDAITVELSNLPKHIRDDLAIAFKRDTTTKKDNQGYWKRRSTDDGGPVEDDLWDVFDADPEFRQLVELPAEPATSGTSATARATRDDEQPEIPPG